jgi:hypothetical protein
VFLLSAIQFVFPCHARAQLSTSDHLQEPGFWATKMYSSLEEFAGSAVCAQCHKETSASQRLTPMARTLSRADGSAVLREHPELGFDYREYKFRIFHCQRQKHLFCEQWKGKNLRAAGLGIRARPRRAIVFVRT